MTKARDLANGGFGLVLIKPSTVVNGTDNGKGTVSFSAASTVSLNDVFSSTYRNYVATVSWSQNTSAGSLGLRLRVSGSDAATNYFWGANGNSSGNISQSNGSGSQTYFYFGHSAKADGAPNAAVIHIHDPFTAARTMFTNTAAIWNAGDFFAGFAGGGMHSTATSYTGLSLTPSAGTITGTIEIYGYNK